MLIKNGKGPTLYKLQGTMAAIIDPKVWEALLKGEQIGVLEHDQHRFSLFADGNYIDSYGVPTLSSDELSDDNVRLSDALGTVRKSVPFLNVSGKWKRVRDTFQAEIFSKGRKILWVIVAGYPTFLAATPEQIKSHQEAGRDTAEKIAQFYKDVIKAGMSASMIDEEIKKHGLIREGRD